MVDLDCADAYNSDSQVTKDRKQFPDHWLLQVIAITHYRNDQVIISIAHPLVVKSLTN